MSIKVGDKVRVEFKNEDGAIEGRVERVWDGGDFETMERVIFAGTNPEGYNITVLEKRKVKVGDSMLGSRVGELPPGSLVRSTISNNNAIVTFTGIYLVIPNSLTGAGSAGEMPFRWLSDEYTVLHINEEARA